jgi:hypothetical protein
LFQGAYDQDQKKGGHGGGNNSILFAKISFSFVTPVFLIATRPIGKNEWMEWQKSFLDRAQTLFLFLVLYGKAS